MKNIKRIIKEEINDFEWAKDIEPYQYSLSDEEWDQLNMELTPLLQNQHLRTGQAYMIALHKVKPSLYDYVTGKDMDPFYNDKKVIKLIRFLNGDNELNESDDFDWVGDIQPMEPGMEWLKDNFDNLKVVKGYRTYYVDSERKPLLMYKHGEENDGFVWVNFKRIWSGLRDNFGLKYSEIQELIKRWLEGSYNLKGFTPTWEDL